MNNNSSSKVWIGIGGIVVGVFLVLVLTPMMRYGGFGMMNWGGGRVSNTPGINAGTLDRHFIEQMIPHHEGAIAMANLALTRASRPEVKTLATAIIKAQEEENTSMRSWYQSWFGRSVPENSAMMGGMMSGGGMHMGGSEDISALENASDFDKAFIEQMIPHHQMAIMMANMLRSGTARPEMQELAQNIIKSQAEEIELMQSWYKNWY